MNGLGKPARKGESPVIEIIIDPSEFQSRAGHVKSCLKIPRPLGKAKYYLVTDSEPVL